jgi:DNA-directed RNA polymerase specialized sigma24 family protein
MTLNNLRSNEIRVEQNRRRLEIEAGLTTAVPETAPDPLDLLIFEEELGETLKGFSDLIRETMNQYYVLGWSPQEIADFNLEGVEAVRKRITRGRDLWKNFHTCETTGE